MKSILNVYVSLFDTCKSVDPGKVLLLFFLTNTDYKKQIEAIRNEPDEKKQKALKEFLPAATISGDFSIRNIGGLVQHSGFIGIDIDYKDNTHINNYSDLKTEIAKIPCVAYCGLSVRGNGYCVVIYLAHPDQHELHFEALKEDFKTIGIVIDRSCRDVSRLRFVSYDPAPYLNHNATPYTRIINPVSVATKPNQRTTYAATGGDNKAAVETLINKLTDRGIDITNVYDDWIHIGFALANEFGESGRQYYHEVSAIASNYNYQETEKKFTNFLKSERDGRKIGTFFAICKDYGVLIKDETVTKFSNIH